MKEETTKGTNEIFKCPGWFNLTIWFRSMDYDEERWMQNKMSLASVRMYIWQDQITYQEIIRAADTFNTWERNI